MAGDVLSGRRMKHFPKKTVLFREGDPGTEMFIIGAGRVEIIKRIGGIEKTVAVVGPGDMIGELALLNGKPRTATAVVLEKLSALVVDQKMLEGMLGKNPDFTMRLIRRLAGRLDVADGLIQMLLHPDPGARDFVLKQAESAKSRAVELAVEFQGEVAADPGQVRHLFGRLNLLRAKLREGTPTAEEMPKPFVFDTGTMKPQRKKP